MIRMLEQVRLVTNQAVRSTEKQAAVPVIGMDCAAHALNNDKICAHSGVRERLWHSAQVEAWAALTIAAHVQPRLPDKATRHIKNILIKTFSRYLLEPPIPCQLSLTPSQDYVAREQRGSC